MSRLTPGHARSKSVELLPPFSFGDIRLSQTDPTGTPFRSGGFPGVSRACRYADEGSSLRIVAMNEAFDFGDHSSTLPKVPRRIAFCVMMLNQISTWLSQDEWVGVKCTW